jgi:hypothetical protein
MPGALAAVRGHRRHIPKGHRRAGIRFHLTSPVRSCSRRLVTFQGRQRLGFSLGSELVSNLLQGADARREGVSVGIDDVPLFPVESGGLFVG